MFRGRIIKTATKLIVILRGKKENESKIEDKKCGGKQEHNVPIVLNICVPRIYFIKTVSSHCK